VRHKLNTIEEEFRGKDVLLVDDSIVRGNTSRQIVQLARAAGARKVLFASTAPPLVHPCVYGIDMSTRREFVAGRDRTTEVGREIEADAVIYQTLDDLTGAVLEGQTAIDAHVHRLLLRRVPDRRHHDRDAPADREPAPGRGEVRARRGAT
jgi:amidophosphoribosyltransferase